MDIIKCCVCRKDKSKDNFSSFHGRLNRSCKNCRIYHNNHYKENSDGYRDKRKQYYKDHKIQHRKRAYKNHLKRKYNLSLEEYAIMLSRQKNKCRICGRDFSELTKWNSACVDHDHKTGRIRGILCRKCNLTLAYIEDFNLWDKAKNYLRLKEIKDKEPL